MLGRYGRNGARARSTTSTLLSAHRGRQARFLHALQHHFVDVPVGIHIALQRIVVDGLVGLIRDNFLLLHPRLRQESFPRSAAE